MEGTGKQEEETAYLDAPLALDRERLDRVARSRREGLEREDKEEKERHQHSIGTSVRIETERSGWRRTGEEETYGNLGQLGFGLDAKVVVHEGEEGLGREEEGREGSAWRTQRQTERTESCNGGKQARKKGKGRAYRDGIGEVFVRVLSHELGGGQDSGGSRLGGGRRGLLGRGRGSGKGTLE
jgi:hypothetical protein